MLQLPDTPQSAASRTDPGDLDLSAKIADLLSSKVISCFSELSGNVALFGGTFDPPQNSHPTVAQAAANKHSIDTVIFMPTFKNRLKDHFPIASPQQRLEMLCLTCDMDARFRVSDWELQQGKFVYTADTLAEVCRAAPKIDQLMFIMGSDLLCHFATWPRRDEILNLARVIPVSAQEFGYEQLGSLEATLGAAAVQKLRDDWVQIPILDIRSKDIRRELAEGQREINEQKMPPLVLEYIRARKLYNIETI